MNKNKTKHKTDIGGRLKEEVKLRRGFCFVFCLKFLFYFVSLLFSFCFLTLQPEGRGQYDNGRAVFLQSQQWGVDGQATKKAGSNRNDK